MNTYQIQLSDDCIVKLDVKPSGIDKLLTIEVSTFIPQAQHPRWQRNWQATMTQCQAWELGTALHSAVSPACCVKKA